MTYPAETGCATGPTTAAPAAGAGFAFIVVIFVLLVIIGSVIVGAY